jgi:hypothetical protein
MEWQGYIMRYVIRFSYDGQLHSFEIKSPVEFNEETNRQIIGDMASMAIGLYLREERLIERDCNGNNIHIPVNISLIRTDADGSIHTLYEACNFNENDLEIQNVSLL